MMKTKAVDGTQVRLKIHLSSASRELGENQGVPHPNTMPASITPSEKVAESKRISKRARANDGEDTEILRMNFAQLLIQSRSISSKTTYKEADQMFSSSRDWNAVDESIRREGFQIFVDTWRTHEDKKKVEGSKKR